MIQYDGRKYKGWQRLGQGENTVQAKIESVVSRLTGVDTEIIGSSRTDAGVHALAQVANFKTETRFSEDEIQTYLNTYLPNDISVTAVTSVPERFHARYNAKRKTYLYKIWNRAYPNPFMRDYSMHVKSRLNVGRMIKAAELFMGEHDFTAYSNAKTSKKTMVREIFAVDIAEADGFIQIRVTGDGFLYNMVRKMVGTLVAAGLGEIEAEDISQIIASKDRSRVTHLADACGLYLERIEFDGYND
jgi:tRNA pseudouridine38-40 synthase